MFTTIIVQPIFNLLVLIYALIPGHNFGLAIIIFTVLVRLLMWPLVKKQLHHTKAMRQLQPEIKKIREAAGGNRQKESALIMELYKERQINPFASLGIVIVQIPILLGLYLGIKRLVDNPQQIIDFSYPALHDLSWMQTLARDIHRFDDSLFGLVNLGQKALGDNGIYWPALLIVVAGAATQYYQSRQLMPRSKDARSLRSILRDAGKGESADQQEVNAAVGRGTLYLIPAFVFIFGLNFPAALPLYWLTSSLVALIQQSRVLKDDVEEAEAIAAKEEASTESPTAAASGPKMKTKKRSSAKSASRKRKRRKR